MKQVFVEYIKISLLKNNESIDVLSQRVLSFIIFLREITPKLFVNLHEQSWSRKQALLLNVSLDIQSIKQIVEKEWDKKYPELGSNFSLWSGGNNDSENVMITFLVGSTSSNKSIENTICIKFPISENYRIKTNDIRISEIETFAKRCWNVKSVDVVKFS